MQLAGTEESLAAAFKSAATVIEGTYGLSSVAHCCLEAHGQVAEWPAPDQAEVPRVDAEREPRTTVKSRTAFTTPTSALPAANIEVSCQYIGGGFGSKFSVDNWGLDLRRALEEGRPPGQADARARSGTADRRHAALRFRARSRSAATPTATSRRGSRRSGARRAWPARSPGRMLPYVFVGIPNSKRTGTAHPDQRRAVARVARAESSAGGRHHDDRARGSRRGAEDGPLDFFMKNLRSRRDRTSRSTSRRSIARSSRSAPT